MMRLLEYCLLSRCWKQPRAWKHSLEECFMDTLSSNTPSCNPTPEYVFIYGLVDPRKKDKIRYVGKADSPRTRLNGHMADSRKKKNRKRPVVCWIKELGLAGLKPEMVIIEQVSVDKWKEAEIYWIALYRFRYDDLLNVHDGGDTCSFEEYSRGEDRPNAKLTDDLVLEMRNLRAQGTTISTLAQRFGIDTAGVVKICHGEMWKHVSGPITRSFSCRDRLTEEQVIEIRTLRAQGMKNMDIATITDVDSGTVSRICRGKMWENMGGPITTGACYREPLKSEDAPNTKLTSEQVVHIREMYATEEYTQEQIGEMFGISSSNVYSIVAHQTWKNVGGPKTINIHQDAGAHRGENHPFAKLTSDQVRHIREMYVTGEYTQARLAQMFSVSPNAINDIVNFAGWKDAGGPRTDDNHRAIAVQKGEYPHGVDKFNSKLTDEVVLEMRTLRSQGVSISTLAEKYEIDNSCIVRVCHGDTWKHVGGPLTRYSHNEIKLTNEIVVKMRTLRAQGKTTAELAKMFEIDQSQVVRICRGDVWKNAGGPITTGVRYGLSGPKGDTHPSAKLTRAKVDQIREMFATGNYSKSQLARMFSVDPSTIWNIVNFRIWK